ncbi:hypothetical protein BYT27DRAFT_7179635 [Phlegmacium glaucopus]|nr:hypothetical protein BYT27DRAFT_7179635 [Phlegmacium glaucopus]
MEFTDKERRELDSLSSQFNILVLIVSVFLFTPSKNPGAQDIKILIPNEKSTFTAALIISFMSFAKDIVGDIHGRPYQFSMFLCILAIGFHLLTIIVASRAGMICFRMAKSLDTETPTPDLQPELPPDSPPLPTTTTTTTTDHIRHSGHSMEHISLSDFQRFLLLCEQLQLVGTTVYLPSALVLLFFMFDRMEFAIVIYGITAIGAWMVYRLGFWKVSVLWHDVHQIGLRCKKVIWR